MNGLVIRGKCFPHRTTHKATWVSPDRTTQNQIHHMLIRKDWRRSVEDTRVYCGIGGFRGRGGRGGRRPSLFSCIFKITLRFCFENRFIKCSLILSSETLTLLYFHHKYGHNAVWCMSWKVKFSFRVVGGRGTRPHLTEVSGSVPVWCRYSQRPLPASHENKDEIT